MDMATESKLEDALVLRDDTPEGITTLTLNRPDKRNALSTGLLAALQNALEDVAADKSVKVLVLAANGPVFSSGHDLKEMRADPSYDAIHDLFEQCSAVMLTMTQLPQPIIARVHGIATAAGCQLVATCDLAVASSDAKFATPGVMTGLFCSTPAVALSRSVGRKHSMEMLLTGDMVDAETALRFGLVNRVAEPDALDATIQGFAQNIISRSTLTISIGKQAFYKQLDMDLDEAYKFASEVMAKNMMAPDAGEGVDAFLGKRKPEWQGR